MEFANEFWCLESPDWETRVEWRTGEVRLETVHCETFPKHQRSGRRIDPLSINLPPFCARSEITDFVWTSYSECLISDRVKAILEHERVSGYELKATRAFINNELVASPVLWELVVTGWGGVADSKSGVKLIYECRECGHRVYSCFTNPREIVNPAQWDESDLFMVWPMPRYIFVTTRTRSILEQQNLSGYNLRRVSELRCSTEDTLTPGSLFYWMPATRAQEIGSELGIV